VLLAHVRARSLRVVGLRGVGLRRLLMASDSNSTATPMQPPSSPPPSTTSAKTQDQQRKRTKDIQIDHDVDFSELLLSPPILKGLSEAGYPQ
jgi:hypothetical protein